jgi:hypothetical protein
MRVVSVGSELPGVVAVGQQATGIVAVGQRASGVIAIGQEATGVIAVGQLALGVVAVGSWPGASSWPGSWASGWPQRARWPAGCCGARALGVGGTSGSPLAYGLFGRLSRRRLIAWVRREPWDSPPRWSTWRRAVGVAGLTALTALWWFAAGQPLVAALA